MADEQLEPDTVVVEKSPYISTHSETAGAADKFLLPPQPVSEAPSILVKRNDTTAIVLSEPVEYSWLNINVFSGPCIQNQDGSFSAHEEKPRGKCSTFFSKMFNRDTVPKHILRNVTGVANSGKILALMGSSGAGKTTLMNILMYRTSRKLKMCGDRFVNGVPVGSSFLNAITGYVQQDDLFLGSLTVKEHLTYQAVFRMERQTTSSERELRVIDVITDCGLQKCMNTRIGSLRRKGISGGERKRLSFASEIITDPSILFCDEPTSGLDNHNAQNIIHVLKKMALSGKTIICTIHQPSSDIFSIFHDILLMAEGRTAFLGPREEALQFFAEQGMICPPTHNPADFFLMNLSVLPFARESLSHAERHQMVEKICDYYEDSAIAKFIKGSMENKSGKYRKSKDFAALETKIFEQEKTSEYKATNWNQNKALIKRALATNWRNITLFGIRVTQLIVVACIFVLIYYRQDMSVTGIRNINGALFLFIVHMTFSSVFGVINTFCEELPLFMREQSDGLYRTTYYFFSKTVADLPIHFLFPLIFASIVYFAIGLDKAVPSFFWCVFILTLVVNVSCSFGYAVSCGTGNVQTALTFIPPLTTPLLIFGGVFVNIDGVSKVISWIQYTSWIYYSTEAIMLNQWDAANNNTIKHCKAIEANGCRASEFGLQGYNFHPEHFSRDIICLCFLTVAFRIIAFIALQIKVYFMTKFQ